MSKNLGTSLAERDARKASTVVGNILRGSAGNMVEWYDFYVFAAFGSYFAKSFFQSGSEDQDTLGVLGIFAAGFVMRPVGSWFFGRFADRRGRRAALTLSVTMMAFGSLLIAVCPPVTAIGYGATIVLFLARLLQGFSVGGEYGTSASYMSEVATKNRRGFFSSFQYVTLVSGQVLALLVQIILQRLLSDADLKAWGWRIPFIIGAAAAVTVMWIRRGMLESVPEEQLAAARGGTTAYAPGSMRLLAKYWKPFLVVIGLTMGGTVAFYTFTTYMLTLMKTTVKVQEQITWINFIALVIFMLLQPVAGMISDKIGRKPLLLWFGIGGTLLTWPILSALSVTKNPLGAFGLMMGALLIVLGYTSINALVKAELFPREVRALGVGLGYGVANAIFGGTAPYIGKALQTAGQSGWFYTYVTVCILVSLIVYVTAFRNKGATALDHEEGHAFETASTPANDTK